MRIYQSLLSLLLVGLFTNVSHVADAQTRTVGKIYYDDAAAHLGYTLFSPNQSNRVYLIENCGLEVHNWFSPNQPGMMSYLRTDGLLLRAGHDSDNGDFPSNGGNGGLLELLDWWSNPVWTYRVSSPTMLAHHDVCPMPNGNILVLLWEKLDLNAAKEAGRDPSQMPGNEIWPETVFEIKPIFPDSATIVWEWHQKDHLIQDYNSLRDNYGNVIDHPELMDVNYLGISQGNADWLHANAIDYNPVRDEIMLSYRETSEVVIIDHSTTTAEAASHLGGNAGKGGDFLFRWGNPEAYRRGTAADKVSFEQHNAHWVPDSLPNGGKIMVFNNGFTRGGVSKVEYVSPTLDSNGHYTVMGGPFLPATSDSTFSPLAGDTINSSIMGGAQQLPNGNLLVTQSVHGRFIEFDTQKRIVWEYISPIIQLGFHLTQGNPVPSNPVAWYNSVFRAIRYDPSYQGLAGQPLPHGAPLEANPYPDSCFTPVSVAVASAASFQLYPQPSSDVLHVRSDSYQKENWTLLDYAGRVVGLGKMAGFETEISTAGLPAGIYVLRIGKGYARKVLVQRL